AGDRQDDHVRHDVARGHPGDLVQRGAQIPHHVGDRHVHDARVQELEHGRERHRDRDDVLVLVAIGVDAERRQGGGSHYLVVIVTTTLIPGRNGWAESFFVSGRIRTGTRCTTLVKLPVALSGGSSENLAPVAGDRLSTCPFACRPGYASTVKSTASPGVTFAVWVSFRFAGTHTSPSGTSPMSAWPGCTS